MFEEHVQLPDSWIEDPGTSSLDSRSFEKLETEAPVPERPIPKRRSKELLLRLKLSQKIGLLLWLNREGLLSEGGKERLLYLQRKASLEAIEAGVRWCSRLSKEKKLQSDFRPHMAELNRRPQSKRFRRTEARRIGIGYRDKGTLPEISSKARTRVIEESWIPLSMLPEFLNKVLRTAYPEAVEGDWFDVTALNPSSEGQDFDIRTFLTPL